MDGCPLSCRRETYSYLLHRFRCIDTCCTQLQERKARATYTAKSVEPPRHSTPIKWHVLVQGNLVCRNYFRLEEFNISPNCRREGQNEKGVQSTRNPVQQIQNIRVEVEYINTAKESCAVQGVFVLLF